MKTIKQISLLTLLLVMLFSLVPLAPPSFDIFTLGDITVDRAFLLALPYLLIDGIQYGPDAVFTYGPWGVLYTGVARADYMSLVWLFNTSYVLCVFLALWYYTGRKQNTSSRLLAWLGCVVFPFLWMTGHRDSYFIFPILFIAFTYFTLHDANSGRVSFKDKTFLHGYALMFLANLLLGWAALAKFNIFILASVINAIILAVDLRRGRIPILPLAFTASVLTAWIMAGQNLANLPSWVMACLDLSNGYSDAMAKGFLKPYGVSVVSAFYFGVLLTVAAGFATLVLDRGNRDRIFLFLFVVFICAVSVKHAFGGNQIEESIAVLATTLWFLALNLKPKRDSSHQAPVFVGVSLVSAVGCLAFVASSVNFPILGIKDALSHIGRNISAISNLDQLQRDHGWSALLSEAHQLAPLGDEFRGKTIDIYPQHTGVVIDREGMHYDPRPAYLSLNAHTRRLVNANAHHLDGNHAPDVVLFQVLPPDQAVNNRYPALADGPSWPLLLSRYDLVGFSSEFLVLRKRADRLQPQRHLVVERKVALGEQVALPHTDSGLVWAEIDIKRTFLGKLIHMAYKSPHVLISTHTTDNIDHTYQLVPELGAAGFLLSPLVENTLSFAQIQRRGIPSRDVVKFVKISSPDAPPGFWARGITLRLFELSLPPTTILNLTPEAQRLLSLQLLDGNITSCLFSPRLEQLNGTKQQVLALHAPCQTEIAVSPANHAMTIKFGLQDSAFSGATETDGVIVQVIALKSDGEEYRRWFRTLDPATNMDDRGMQQMTISWPDATVQRIVIKMLPGANNDPSYDHSYIQDVFLIKKETIQWYIKQSFSQVVWERE